MPLAQAGQTEDGERHLRTAIGDRLTIIGG
jgi:hypothetical protein